MSVNNAVRVIIQKTTRAINRSGRIPILLILTWLVTLWWGERNVFANSVSECAWHRWESWPTGAAPHHVLLIADPQLVDPHTYPGRPWPLSTLTVLYTDLYMRRIYGYLLNEIQPHSTLFLGDLFDGGREWASVDYQSPEKQYQQYGNNFWLNEYNRFMDMFVGRWYKQDWEDAGVGEGRRIITSLPGNHDLGFASGINKHVRNRFEAHFGPSNRIDILGNHSFVSLDTVSLSAMDQVDPATGSSGAGDGTAPSTKHTQIWKPVEDFLINAKGQRAKSIRHRLHHLRSSTATQTQKAKELLFEHQVHQVTGRSNKPKGFVQEDQNTAVSSSFPTILLTHVPLYRNNDVTCGPLRERGEVIPLSAGYQYQNVLKPSISKDIVDHLDAEQITMIYSGDDHDYCEIEHGEFNGQIKEITVKSISWAMGVRKPGVQLASLWNPIDIDATTKGEASPSTPRGTVQNQLCLLPDQLAIFIRYGQLAVLSIIALLIRTITYKPTKHHHPSQTSPGTEKDKSEPLLPLTRKQTPPLAPISTSTTTQHPTSTSTSARARSNGKLNGYGNLPASSRSASPVKEGWHADTDDWGMPQVSGTEYQPATSASVAHARPYRDRHDARDSMAMVERLMYSLTTPAQTKLGELARSVSVVAPPVFLFYFWLLWNG